MTTEWKDYLTFQWWDTTSAFLHEGRPCFTLYLTDGLGLNLIQHGGEDWRMNMSMQLPEDIPLGGASTFVEAKEKAVQTLHHLYLHLCEMPDCDPTTAERFREVAEHLLTYDEDKHGAIVR